MNRRDCINLGLFTALVAAAWFAGANARAEPPAVAGGRTAKVCDISAVLQTYCRGTAPTSA